ncbi:glycoside hydrolase family 3 N-terminal domain-containing protein [Streptomyces sp. P6-2-1]|uniref:glycoside hydrolase family 3 N-terminal domain-containing protein n=1 Tax=Streptomyces sp. P6-2-1 TaxID=3422591 RepID=UPI003D36EA51
MTDVDPDLRRLAHTVLMPGFGGTGRSGPPAWLLAAIGEGLGSVCWFGHNVTDRAETAALAARLHAAGDVLVALDEEGGTVTRLHVADGSPHAGAATLGRADDPALTAAVARSVAQEVRAHGADLVLGPVADVNADPANPVIGVRSYGAEPHLVGRHVAAFVAAAQAEGVAACAKHYPGHGDTRTDTHAGLAVVDVSPETLRTRELVPFAAAVAAGARAIMTAHIVFPALDDAPATLSPAVLRLLREDLGFTGVVVSDAIDMRAISRTVGFAEGVVRTLAAGVDLVCLGNPGMPLRGEDGGSDDGERDFRTALDAITAAVTEGRLPRARLAQAAARVRDLAAWSARHRTAPVDEAVLAAGHEASEAAARLALTVRGDVAGTLTGSVHLVDVRRRRNIASGKLSDHVTDALLARAPGARLTRVFARGEATEGRVTEESAAGPVLPEAADVILVGTPHADPEQAKALDALIDAHPDALVVCLGWPAGPDDLPRARRLVCAYGDARPNAKALAELLTGA